MRVQALLCARPPARLGRWHARTNAPTRPPCRRYWIGYTVQSGVVWNALGQNLGSINSSSEPYLHFTDHNNAAGPQCVGMNFYDSYNQYKWW